MTKKKKISTSPSPQLPTEPRVPEVKSHIDGVIPEEAMCWCGAPRKVVTPWVRETGEPFQKIVMGCDACGAEYTFHRGVRES